MSTVFKLVADIPEKILSYFYEYMTKHKYNIKRGSPFLKQQFIDYLENNDKWNIPPDVIFLYDSFGKFKRNNFNFYLDNKYKDKLLILSKTKFLSSRMIVKHFSYSLYYKLSST